MPQATEHPLATLYLEDETAWLEAMSRLAADRRAEDFDFENLAEYLSSMANRDRKGVRRRMVILMMHLLKWKYQPGRRSLSWVKTILAQRDVLRFDLKSRTLRNFAESQLADVYSDARRDAATETGLELSAFPEEWAMTLDEFLAHDPELRVR